MHQPAVFAARVDTRTSSIHVPTLNRPSKRRIHLAAQSNPTRNTDTSATPAPPTPHTPRPGHTRSLDTLTTSSSSGFHHTPARVSRRHHQGITPVSPNYHQDINHRRHLRKLAIATLNSPPALPLRHCVCVPGSHSIAGPNPERRDDATSF